MKIQLKHISALKWLFVVALPLIVIIGAAAIYFVAFRSLPPAKISIPPPAAVSGNVAAKTRKSSIKPRIKVISPVNLVDDQFKGYDLHGVDAEDPAADQQQPLQNESRATEEREELSQQPTQPEKIEKQVPAVTKQEHVKKKEDGTKDKAFGISEKSAERTAASDGQPDASVSKDEGLNLLNERLLQTGLSDIDRKKMIQSYLDLRKVLPEREAQKMIMWQLRQKKQ